MKKENLIICCSDTCILSTREALVGPPRAPLGELGGYFVVDQPGALTTLTRAGRISRVGFSQLFNSITTCAHVTLSERQVDLLRTRLKNPAAWPGYFPKIP